MAPHRFIGLDMARFNPVNDRLWRNTAVFTRLEDRKDIIHQTPLLIHELSFL
jgi:hypothetical protein